MLLRSRPPTAATLKGPVLPSLGLFLQATKGKQSIAFYTIPEYEEWSKHNDTRNWAIKYYKARPSCAEPQHLRSRPSWLRRLKVCWRMLPSAPAAHRPLPYAAAHK